MNRFTVANRTQMIWRVLCLEFLLSATWLCASDIPTTKTELCNEVATFIPSICNHPEARLNCEELCKKQEAPSQLNCGINSQEKRFRRIIGGSQSEEGQWPWHVSIQYLGKHLCGASIISKRFIITAAHCVDEKYLKASNAIQCFTVLVGSNKQIPDASSMLVPIRRIASHPDYNVKVLRWGKNEEFVVVNADIAIIELAEELDFSQSNVNSICLPDVLNPFPEKSDCYIIGWGFTKFAGRKSEELRHAKIPTVPLDVCNANDSFENKITSFHSICAGFPNGSISPCNFDSGGSLACKKNGLWYERGIISSGYKCGGPNAYSLYTNIASFEDWIIKTIVNEEYISTIPYDEECSPSGATPSGANELNIIGIVFYLFIFVIGRSVTS